MVFFRKIKLKMPFRKRMILAMKAIFFFLALMISVMTAAAGDKSELMLDDPEPKVPERTTSKSEEAELLLPTGNATQQSVEGRQVKENQEEIDPIFYDSTTSPAEMLNA